MSAVKQHHIDFARAVVKLAREHKMDNLHLRFQDSISQRDFASYEQMSMYWAEGRHGDQNDISINCQAQVKFSETPDA